MSTAADGTQLFRPANVPIEHMGQRLWLNTQLYVPTSEITDVPFYLFSKIARLTNVSFRFTILIPYNMFFLFLSHPIWT
jgi:hypothetical protein